MTTKKYLCTIEELTGLTDEGTLASLRKWVEARRRTEAGESFSWPQGFEDLIVWEACHYCKTYVNIEYIYYCRRCPLWKEGICCENIDNALGVNVAACEYILEMRKDNPDRKLAARWAGEVVAAIRRHRRLLGFEK